jgi:hypothetical protein
VMAARKPLLTASSLFSWEEPSFEFAPPLVCPGPGSNEGSSQEKRELAVRSGLRAAITALVLVPGRTRRRKKPAKPRLSPLSPSFHPSRPPPPLRAGPPLRELRRDSQAQYAWSATKERERKSKKVRSEFSDGVATPSRPPPPLRAGPPLREHRHERTQPFEFAREPERASFFSAATRRLSTPGLLPKRERGRAKRSGVSLVTASAGASA